MQNSEHLIYPKRPYEQIVFVALLLFGGYLSFVFWGRQPVPNPDFFGYLDNGEALLSWQFSSIDYRQLPLLSLLQIGLSKLIGGGQAELTAGWTINAILHPVNLVLVWLIGKRFLEPVLALGVAILVGVNPVVLRMMTDPIAETTFLFFILVTFYFVFRRSHWGYVFAFLCTMVRYEGAALIVVALFMDLINHSKKEERILALKYAVLAGLPLCFWLLMTFFFWERQEDHYLNYFSGLGGGGIIERLTSREFINLMWSIGFYHLHSAIVPQGPLWIGLSKVGILGGLAFGVCYSLWKREWKIPALCIFLTPYLIVHSAHSIFARHGVAILWIFLLIFFYGIERLWVFLDLSHRIPEKLMIFIQILLGLLSLAFLLKAFPEIQQVAGIHQRAIPLSIPLTGLLVLVGIWAVYIFLERTRDSWAGIVWALIFSCMMFSSQETLIKVMSDGSNNIEFKLLSQWYDTNARPDEKLVATHADIVGYFSSASQNLFIRNKEIKADDPAEFYKKCLEMKVKYVAWDSRASLKSIRREDYYQKWQLKNTAMLENPESNEWYEFLSQINVDDHRYVNVFLVKQS